MAQVEIKSYFVAWSSNDRTGYVQLNDAGGQGIILKSREPNEIQLMVDILRNEKPVYYDTRGQVIRTGPEPTGEGES